MKIFKNTILLLVFSSLSSFAQLNKKETLNLLLGDFIDDYGSKYTITEKQWIHHGNGVYHIIKWDFKQQYVLLINDKNNKTAPNKYTRIDFMNFSKMEPWIWGYCYTIYKAENKKIAKSTANADRINPKKGCNGYPFSRMKKN